MPKPRTTNKTRNVSFRLTEAEYARLAHQATTANMRVNHLARKLTTSKAKRLTITTHQSHDPALIRQLYHIGHNLNQLTKAAHLGRISPQIEALCQRIDTLMNRAIGKEDNQ